MWSYALVGPSQFARREISEPNRSALRDGQVLLRVLAGGICGSDLPWFKGAQPPVGRPNEFSVPRRPGEVDLGPDAPGRPLHEVVGEVLASADPRLVVGSRVVGWATDSNGLSELIVVDGDDILEYDTSIAPAIAVLLQTLACVIGAVERIPGIPGASAVVFGLGPIGMLFSHVLNSMGADRVVGVDPVDRSAVARSFGVAEAVHARSDRWVAGLSNAERPDIVVDAVGHQVSTLGDAIEAVKLGGRIFYFGVPDDPVYPIPMLRFFRKDLTLIAGITRHKREALAKAEKYLDVHPGLKENYVTHRFSFQHVQSAFEVASRPAMGQLKVVLDRSL